jgi:DNA double-strand break repair helicase HerA and related ATPase
VTGSFKDTLAAGYKLDEPGIILGSPLDGATVYPDVRIQVALSMLSRHGLIAGATGTGKTKTLQGIAGQLSLAGVPCLVADIKGDVSGMALPGDATNPKVQQRIADLGLDYVPTGHPVEFLSLSGKLGSQLRASVHSFGPLLLGRVLDLNDTQTSVLSLVFKYCDDNALPLLDLKDLTTTLKFLGSDDGKAVLADYGGIAPATLGVIQRSIITLQQQGADVFFGEPEFDVDDLLRTTSDGHGIVSVLELPDVMDKPALFSTFMLWLLAQLYHALPEVGDLPKPRLCFFFDEAHLLFDGASDALLDQIEHTVRLIRSKGVGVYFITQTPTDVPSSVLAQLGNRIQHALRVFTPEDSDNLKKTVRTFPMTEFFDTAERLVSLGIGEALVTVLSPNGVPTPLAPTRLVPPDSLMAALPPDQLQARILSGSLYAKYDETIDPQSAHEIITARLLSAQAAAAQAAAQAATQAAAAAQGAGTAYPPGAYGTQAGSATQAREMQREMARLQREAERAGREQAKREAQAAAQAHRAKLQREREITQVGTTLLRGVMGTLFGRRR